MLLKGSFRRKMINLSREFPKLIPAGSTVIDVGAGDGYYTFEFAKATGPEGVVLAFEGDNNLYQQLVEKLLGERPSRVISYNVQINNRTEVITDTDLTHDDVVGTRLHRFLQRKPALPFISKLSLIRINHEKSFEILDGLKDLLENVRPYVAIQEDGQLNIFTYDDYRRQYYGNE